MDVRTIRTRRRALEITVEAPPSKSVTHRALVAASLARGASSIRNALVSDDTRATCGGLAELGVEIRRCPQHVIVVGTAGTIRGGGRLNLRESGTSLRLLSAVASLGQRPSELDGAHRLRQRPIEELAVALRSLGGRFESTGWPLSIGGADLSGGPIALSGGRSSQFASALMMIAPSMPNGLRLELIPPVVSAPYIELTARVMREFGASVERESECRWRVRPGSMQGRDFRVEGDHSSVSYFLAAAAICGGSVCVRGIDPMSAQPDARLGSMLAELGCRFESGPDWIRIGGVGRIPAFRVDLADAPDLAPTVAALALFAEGPCRISGLAHLPFKESDRLSLLVENLNRLGRSARVAEGAIEIDGDQSRLKGNEIATASDHRMAMAFALAGLRLEGVRIPEPRSVEKSNPAFWDQWALFEGG